MAQAVGGVKAGPCAAMSLFAASYEEAKLDMATGSALTAWALASEDVSQPHTSPLPSQALHGKRPVPLLLHVSTSPATQGGRLTVPAPLQTGQV